MKSVHKYQVQLLILCFIQIGCTGSKVTIDSSSSSTIKQLNMDIQLYDVTVFLNDGIRLLEGTFYLSSDTLTHFSDIDSSKYALSEIRSIVTTGDHRKTSRISLGLIAGAAVIYASSKEAANNAEYLGEGLGHLYLGALGGFILGAAGITTFGLGKSNVTTKYYFKK